MIWYLVGVNSSGNDSRSYDLAPGNLDDGTGVAFPGPPTDNKVCPRFRSAAVKQPGPCPTV
jgi:hypothetical protein